MFRIFVTFIWLWHTFLLLGPRIKTKTFEFCEIDCKNLRKWRNWQMLAFPSVNNKNDKTCLQIVKLREHLCENENLAYFREKYSFSRKCSRKYLLRAHRKELTNDSKKVLSSKFHLQYISLFKYIYIYGTSNPLTVGIFFCRSVPLRTADCSTY